MAGSNGIERVDVVVVGAGVMGAATAWALSKAGVDTVVLDQFEPGHANGSSHGATRIFRFAYDDPYHVALAQKALPLWRELEDVSKQDLLTITGGLDYGSTDYLSTSAAALRSQGAKADILDDDEVRVRFPNVDYGTQPALFSPDTGVLAADRCITALLDAYGVPVRTGVKVESLAVDDDGATLRTSSGGLRADHVVLTAGAWTGPLLQTIGIDAPLQVTREQIFYFAGGEDLPVVIERGETLRYLLPPAFGAPGTKAGEHGSGLRTTADDRSFDIDPDGQQRITDWIGKSFPDLLDDPIGAETCLYTLTPDEQFVIDTRGPVVFASPCSGHGFKFAPILGEVLAALAMNEDPPVDPSLYTLDRFGP